MSGSGCQGCKNAQNGGCARAKAGQPIFPVSVLTGDPQQSTHRKAKTDHERWKSDQAVQCD